MIQNDKRFCLSLHISETVPHMIVIFDTHVQNDDISSNFFHFFEILTFWVFRREGVKGQKMTHNHQFQSVSLYISTTVDHIIKIFGTHV